MRTTLTLDEDVATKLQSESRRSGRSFREVVNETLRRGLVQKAEPRVAEPFKVAVRDLGELRPGVSLDNVQALIEQVEGPAHR